MNVNYFDFLKNTVLFSTLGSPYMSSANSQFCFTLYPLPPENILFCLSCRILNQSLQKPVFTSTSPLDCELRPVSIHH